MIDMIVVPRVARRKIWSAMTRAALRAGRCTAFARHPATALVLKKRRRAEYRLPPHSKFFAPSRENQKPLCPL